MLSHFLLNGTDRHVGCHGEQSASNAHAIDNDWRHAYIDVDTTCIHVDDTMTYNAAERMFAAAHRMSGMHTYHIAPRDRDRYTELQRTMRRTYRTYPASNRNITLYDTILRS